MGRNAWEIYWSDPANHEWWQKPAPEVLDFIGSLSPDRHPKVLDLGCGLGRHAVAFALAGFCVTAADASHAAVRHLTEWAEGLRLSVETRVCDVLDDSFRAETFDVVLSYNVIYHGSRGHFSEAIALVWKWLRPGGVFYFTCPTRQDGKYGLGEMVAPHTYRCTKSITPGDVHYFADERDLDELLEGFRIVARPKEEGYWENKGEQQFYSNWHVRAVKM